MEWLANLSVKWVLIAIGTLVLALGIFRSSWDENDQTWAWLNENLQVVLSVVVVVFLIIRPFLFQAFYIPSSSMEPTLLGPDTGGHSGGAGDRLLVNKLIYRVSNPHRGDIVVFNAPPQASEPDEENPRGKEFIKRVMGEPGETISVAPPRLVLDGKQAVSLTNAGSKVNTETISGITANGEKPTLSGDATSAKILNGDAAITIMAAPQLNVKGLPYKVELNGKALLESADGKIEEIKDVSRFGADKAIEGRAFRIESNPGALDEPDLVIFKGKHLDYRPGQVMVNGKPAPDYTPISPQYGMGPVTLKPGEYFMMGDNRNNSNDSHEWGPLTRDRVIGRAEIIFWAPQRFRILDWWLIIAMVILFGSYEMLQKLLRGRPQPPRPKELSPERVGVRH